MTALTDLTVRIAIALLVLWYLMPEEEHLAGELAALQTRIRIHRAIAEYSGKRVLKLEAKYYATAERGRMI